MIKSKYITAITAIMICVSIIACVFIVYAANTFESTNVPEYQKKLFSDEVLTIDIQVDDAEWQGLLDNASSKEYISGNLVIDGKSFSTVGIRTKGNASLAQVVSSNSDRYSLEFKFNHYVKGQTCYGLDSFCVNNIYADATYMKDIISYDIFKYTGIKTPLVNYASVTVNGEDWGFYLALERYNKSFIDRVYGTSAGQLYNVKNQMGQGGGGGQGNNPQNNQADPNGQNNGANIGQMGNGGMGGRSGGGSLVYTDDEISSYGSIFDNAVFSKVTDEDKQRVITAIKNLNQGTNLEQYFDVDEILRYFAAHTVVVNLDSYISDMQQNYYIYERDGKITILPWDYHLSFGGFQSSSAASVVNFPIDTPVSDVSMSDRPLLDKLLEVDAYKEKYHQYLEQIVDGYFNSGVFETTVLALNAKINEYVKNDVSAFYTYEKYENSLPLLIELGKLRAVSIEGQLNGTIPSTTVGQNNDSSSLVDAPHINLSDLGTMGGGGKNGGGFGGNADMSKMRDAMKILRSSTDGTLSDEQLAALHDLGLSDDEITQLQQMPNQGGNPPNQNAGQPGGGNLNANNLMPEPLNTIDWIIYGAIGIILLGAILFMAFYKRRKMMS